MLDAWRKEIDDLDEKLVLLLNERAKLALKIGREKRRRELPIKSLVREEKVLKHAVGANSGPLGADAVRRIFRLIIDECCRLEESGS
jgi:chorismate mutase